MSRPDRALHARPWSTGDDVFLQDPLLPEGLVAGMEEVNLLQGGLREKESAGSFEIGAVAKLRGRRATSSPTRP